MTRVERYAAGSILVGIIVLAAKLVAWRLTGSAALYSDALETVVNVVAAAAALLALHVSAQPEDERHPFGHDKAEFFAAAFEGALIVVAALLILQEAWRAWQAPHAIAQPFIGLIANFGGTALNAIWGGLLIRKGKRARSPALRADGKHLLADVALSIGVAAGVLATVASGIAQLDPLVAAIGAVYVLVAGARVIAESAEGLLDAAPAANVLRHIRELITKHGSGGIEVHALRARRGARRSFVQFHLVVPGAMTVSESHRICDNIQHALEAEFPDMLVTIHVEPEEKAINEGLILA